VKRKEKVLVTGGSGFIGGSILKELLKRNTPVIASLRSSNSQLPNGISGVEVGDLNQETDWTPVLKGVSVVVHSAARVHVMKETEPDSLDAFRAANVIGSLRLARQAALEGVRRFVFISTIKVNGEVTLPGHPFSPDDLAAPEDPYGISKWEAEQELRSLAASTEMDVVIIRPPLVYGPGVKANFLTMIRWLSRGIPLPLGAIDNKRSLVALDNLVDLVITCIYHPYAANQTFLVSDGEDISTSELLRRTAAVLGKPAHLLPVPQSLLVYGLQLLGRSGVANRLCASLQVDIEKTMKLLDWSPPISLDEGLNRAVARLKLNN